MQIEQTRIREQIERSLFSSEELLFLQNERLYTICNFWSSQGSPNAKLVLESMSKNNGSVPWNALLENSRILNNHLIIVNIKNSIREISSSGSSGDRLNYKISLSWRLAHHIVWEMAYKHMSQGIIQNYLDKSLFWAMARPFGGKLDSLPNQLECVPTSSGISYVGEYKNTNIDIVHGSITTILEMLEDKFVQKWNPNYVILTYEKSQQWQKEVIKQYWTRCFIHEEYASNDGGVSAFTCNYGNLHFWTNRSLFSITNNNFLCIDLWNDATCFIGYNNGDEVEISHDQCNCGLNFPIVKVNGRASGNIILENGKKIPHLGPFSPSSMKGIVGVRILIERNNKATVMYVPIEEDKINFDHITSELEQFGFNEVVFQKKHSLLELRHGIRKKFSIVIDNR